MILELLLPVKRRLLKKHDSKARWRFIVVLLSLPAGNWRPFIIFFFFVIFFGWTVN